MAVKPQRDYILVTQAEEKKTTESGIILSSDTTTGIKPAYVMAVGPEVVDIKPDSSVYLKWSEATAITHQGVEAALVKEESVLAVIE